MRDSSAEQPNHFELKGEYVKVIYDSSGIAGKPQFTYEDAGGVKQFSGDEIRHKDTECGLLVTVTADQIEGRTVHGTTLTVLIPIFNLKDYESSFTTWAITTTRRPAPGEPELPWGALQTYRVDELRGTAQRVRF